jgi:ABC-type dipeptide/oligopeptide/nickel transport system permease component
VYRYVWQRLAWAVPTAVLVLLAVFSLMHLTPGDPARLVAGEDAPLETVEAVRHDLGLDRPVVEQFTQYASRLVRLDFGRSIHSKRPVRDDLAQRLPATLQLAMASLFIAVSIGGLIGVLSAVRRGTWWDVGGVLAASMLASAPSFWVGLMLILLFAVSLGWLPPAGRGGLENLILPAVTLAGNPLALIARLVRSECLEVLGEDYVRTARAKGLREGVVLFRHAVRNALLPVMTMVGLQFGAAMAGAIVVETVFGWPGVGSLLVTAIFRRDFPVVQGAVLVVALIFLTVNFLVDLAYAYVDPRVRYQ